MKSITKSLLSREKIEELVRANFGDGAVVEDIDEFTRGMFNAVYILTFREAVQGYKEMVLKVGTYTHTHILTYEKEIMKAEVSIYEILEKTEIPVPAVIKYDYSKTLVDCHYFFMEKLTGDTWENLSDQLTAENWETLQKELGTYHAVLHSVHGPYFGYVKEDKAYQFPTWREAFQSFIHTLMEDGKNDKVELPYDEILAAYEPLWPLLDEVKEPCLVNYDMWTKNILLKKAGEQYTIEGIIDHERSFYGDPCAELISVEVTFGSMEAAKIYQEAYGQKSGNVFRFTKNERIRVKMYYLYLWMLLGVEIYRYEKEEADKMLEQSRELIHKTIGELKEMMKS